MSHDRKYRLVRAARTLHSKSIGISKINPHSEGLTGQLRAYLMSNLLSILWTTILVVGGGWFLSYSLIINYFPSNFDFNAAAALLAAISITGLGFIVLSSLLLVIPGWIHRELLCDINEKFLLDDAGDPKNLFLLLAMPMLIGAAGVWDISQGSSLHWLILFMVPFVIALWIKVGEFANEPLKNCAQRYMALFSNMHGVLGLGGSKFLVCLVMERFRRFGTLLLVTVLNGIIFVLTSWFIVLICTAKYAQNHPSLEGTAWLIFGEMTLLAIMANWVVASTGKNKWFIPVFALAILLFTLVLSEQFSSVLKAPIKILKLGDIENVTLLVDQEGCQVAYGFGIVPKPVALMSLSQPGAKLKDEKVDVLVKTSSSETCILSPVNVLSRMGSEYYLEVKQLKGRQDNQAQQEPLEVPLRFVIQSSHVLSWSVVEKQVVKKNK